MFFENTKYAVVFLLFALVISAGSVFGQEDQAQMTVSVAHETPVSQIVPAGTQNFLATTISVSVSGYARLNGATIGLQDFCEDQDFQEVSFWDKDLCLGSGKIEGVRAILDFSPIPLLLDQTKNFDIRVSVAPDAGTGHTFSLGVIDVDTSADMVTMPIGGAFGNPMTISVIDIGELRVVAYQATPSYAVIGEQCSPAGAVLRNSEAESVIANAIFLQVDGDFSVGDIEQLSVGIGDSDMIRLGPVEPGDVYRFDGNWLFNKGQEKTLEVYIFVKSGAGHNFSISVVDIVATGETYGFQVPIIGLPIGGGLIKIVDPQDQPKIGLYGWVTDLDGGPLKATVIAINAETKAKNIAVSDDNGYYELQKLLSGTYYIVCYKQYYELGFKKEFLKPNEGLEVNFRLKKK